jgi:hypothetical protein
VDLGRRFLFAVVVYVTLDFSLPEMPGAFVFEPTDSVETVQRSRGWAPADAVLLSAVARHRLAIVRPRVEVTGLEINRTLGRPVHPVVTRLPRAALLPAPPSADPH